MEDCLDECETGLLASHAAGTIPAYVCESNRGGVGQRCHDHGAGGHLSVKMKKKYSHTRQEAKRQAIATLDMQ
jgi:hypothetical protein